ncbi:hypothetical protein KCU65_g6, partial [Aureobasidium melanogenum]
MLIREKLQLNNHVHHNRCHTTEPDVERSVALLLLRCFSRFPLGDLLMWLSYNAAPSMLRNERRVLLVNDFMLFSQQPGFMFVVWLIIIKENVVSSSPPPTPNFFFVSDTKSISVANMEAWIQTRDAWVLWCFLDEWVWVARANRGLNIVGQVKIVIGAGAVSERVVDMHGLSTEHYCDICRTVTNVAGKEGTTRQEGASRSSVTDTPSFFHPQHQCKIPAAATRDSSLPNGLLERAPEIMNMLRVIQA